MSESAGEATPVSSPRSLKKFALGLRQSRSLGRGAFAKVEEDWSFYARQRKQENPQVLKVHLEKAQLKTYLLKDCPECGRMFSTGAGLACHMRNKH